MSGHRSRLRVFLGVGVVLVASVISPLAANANQPATPVTQWTAPSDPGAPFRPEAGRLDVALERLALLERRDGIADALREIEDPRIVGVLRSENRRINTELGDLDDRAYRGEVEPFGLDVAVFPVDELRKMFWDDWGQPRSGGRRHQGNDTLAQIGTPLRAIEDSVIVKIGNGGLAGLAITVDGASGSAWFYAHLDSVREDLEVGDRVRAGEVIGTVGDTGNARGAPHLHLQWASDGETWENPFPVLDVLWGGGAPPADESLGPFIGRR